MPGSHERVVQAIIDGRSSTCGSVIYPYEDCGEPPLVARCCGHRHGPVCQQGKAESWLARQLERPLPPHDFRLTFTVPQALRDFLAQPPRVGDGALFDASSEAIKTLAADEKPLGADLPGFFGVWPTWGRQLPYPPPIHDVVPGGGFSSNGQGRSAERGFFLPVQALSPIFRAKFRDAMAAASWLESIDAQVWTVDWNVNGQAVGDAQASLLDLSREVFKGAISEGRIVRADESEGVFRYRKVKSSRERKLTLSPTEFIRRFLPHVLPTGFMKGRDFGFLSPSCSIPLDEGKARIELAHGFQVRGAPEAPLPTAGSEKPGAYRCPHGSGALRWYSVRLPRPRGSRELAQVSRPVSAVAATPAPKGSG